MMFVLLGLLGLSVGSFLNVVIDRVPEDKSLLNPPSHCDACKRRLFPWDLVPLFSYLWLRGRCRYCGGAIPLRVPLVEMATGIGFSFLGYWHGFSLPLLFSLVYLSLFLPLFVIDLEKGLLPDKITFPGMVLALAFSFFIPGMGIVRALLGGGVGFGALLLVYILSRGGFGGGDVKLGALLGLAAGFPLVLVSLLVAIIGGGVVAGLLLVTGRKKRRDTMPFGPFLSAGGMVALLWGDTLLNWYWRIIL